VPPGRAVPRGGGHGAGHPGRPARGWAGPRGLRCMVAFRDFRALQLQSARQEVDPRFPRRPPRPRERRPTTTAPATIPPPATASIAANPELTPAAPSPVTARELIATSPPPVASAAPIGKATRLWRRAARSSSGSVSSSRSTARQCPRSLPPESLRSPQARPLGHVDTLGARISLSSRYGWVGPGWCAIPMRWRTAAG
jgi:hypothetical protein